MQLKNCESKLMIILNIIIIFIGIIIMGDASFSHTFIVPAAIAIALLVAGYFNKCIKDIRVLSIFFLLGSAYMAFNYYSNRIYYAVWHGEIAKIKELADNGWNLNRKYNGYHLVDIALEYGSAPSHAHYRHDNPIQDKNRPEVIKEILQTIIANRLSQDGIMLAIDITSANCLDISDFALQYLDINHIANLNELSRWKQGEDEKHTITHIAIKKEDTNLLRKLLKLKPDPNLKDGSNMTILEYAKKCGNENIISMVQEYSNIHKE